MADLDPLIRYRKHAVDEKQRVLAQMYRDAENLERQRQRVIDMMEKEKKLAAEMDTPEAHTYLGRYLEGARKKVRAFDAAIKKIEARIAAAQDDMREAFAEQKKVEIIQRNRQARERAARDRKDDAEMDENAIDGYRRRRDDES
jgi:flagellar export protein FliJ